MILLHIRILVSKFPDTKDPGIRSLVMEGDAKNYIDLIRSDSQNLEDLHRTTKNINRAQSQMSTLAKSDYMN
jgi:hypothetical protein